MATPLRSLFTSNSPNFFNLAFSGLLFSGLGSLIGYQVANQQTQEVISAAKDVIAEKDAKITNLEIKISQTNFWNNVEKTALKDGRIFDNLMAMRYE